MTRITNFSSVPWLVVLLLAVAGCGVKGDPLPPGPDSTDLLQGTTPSPVPSSWPAQPSR